MYGNDYIGGHADRATDRGGRRGRARHDARVTARRRGYEVVHLEREGEARGRVRPQLRPGLGQRPAAARSSPSRCAPASCGPRSPTTCRGWLSGLRARSPWPDEAELAVPKEAAAGPTPPARLRAARRGRGTGGQPGPARRARRRPAVPGRRVVEPAPGAAGAARLAGRPAALQLAARTGGDEIAPSAVRDHTGEWHHGDLVLVCTGRV